MVGAFFGLGAAYDVVDDATVKSDIADLATRLIGFIAQHQWSPNDDISNTFALRPEELQMLLQVARHVNPSNSISGPFLVLPVETAVLVDVQSNSSYYKFNLDYMTFYNLVRLQNNSDNQAAYRIVRDYTASHQNAFFDIVDRALEGANASRDAEMRSLLDQWLQRPKRETYVDLSQTVAVCGSEACQPIPVPLRPTVEFLWQIDPFQLAGGGDGTVEGSGIDYILPYWMGRYYGVIAGGAVESAAAPSSAVAPNSLASLYGANLAPGVAQASCPAAAIGAGRGDAFRYGCRRRRARRTAALRFAGPDQFRGSGRHGARPGDVGGCGSDVHRRRSIRCAHALQHERSRQRSGGCHCDYGSGRQPAPAVFRAGVSMRRHRAALRCRSFWVSTRRFT